MGWGDAFDSAWDSAKAAARKAAANLATGAREVGRQSIATLEWCKEQAQAGYQWSKEKAIAGVNFAHDQAIKGYQWGKSKVAQTLTATKDLVRGGERTLADHGFDAATKVHGAAVSGTGAVKAAFDQVTSVFSHQEIACPVAKCPSEPQSDIEADGWFMAPQAGTGCRPMPPGTPVAQVRERAYQSDNDCCKARRAAGEPPRDILYVNGINTDRKTHCETLHAIAEQTCGRVIGIYNATENGLGDAVQTGQDRLLIKSAAEGKRVQAQDGRNKAVASVSNVLKNEIRAGAKPELWAHSQGGAVTSLALYDARNTLRAESAAPGNPLAGVKVKSMGSAAPYWADGPQYEHYVHVDDATPTLFGLGLNAREDVKHAGQGAKVIRASGDPQSEAPFESAAPTTSWAPSTTAHHDVEKTYLRMEKQQNGGCP